MSVYSEKSLIKQEKKLSNRVKKLPAYFLIGPRRCEPKKIRFFLSFLRKIFGIGFVRSSRLVFSLGFSLKARVNKLNYAKIEGLLPIVLNNYGPERVVKNKYNSNIEKHFKIKDYKSLRFEQRLPTRGQRSRSNHYTIRRLFFKKTQVSKKKHL